MLSLEEILPLYSQNTSCYERIWGRSEDVGIICSKCGLAVNCCSCGAGGKQGESCASAGSPGAPGLVGPSRPGAGYIGHVQRQNLFSSSCVIYWMNGASRRIFWMCLYPRAWKQFAKSTSSKLSWFCTFTWFQTGHLSLALGFDTAVGIRPWGLWTFAKINQDKSCCPSVTPACVWLQWSSQLVGFLDIGTFPWHRTKLLQAHVIPSLSYRSYSYTGVFFYGQTIFMARLF